MTSFRHHRLAGAAILATLVALACDDDDPTDLPGALAVSVDPASLGIVPPGSGTINVTVGRTGTVGNPVVFSISGLPTGVTATIVPPQLVTVTETNATVTLTAGSGAPLGNSLVTVTATAPNIAPVGASFQLQLTALVSPRF